MEKRLFVVSNRLPLTVCDEKGLQPASGGLVSALNSYLSNQKTPFKDVFWCGIPGCSMSSWMTAIEQHQSPSFYTYLPVFPRSSDYEGYYNGFANSALWPLFHYFPSYAEYNMKHYEQYCIINNLFAETLFKNVHAGDTIWIHDYHLLLLPAMLRRRLPELNIGFFLHIPFPSFELFRLLPKKWQEESLLGLLGADLIGFHTIDYAAHFLQSVQMVLGMDNERHILHHDNRLIKVDVFPISIDFHKFHEAFNNDEVRSLRMSLKPKHPRKMIFSVDRLDYTKGVHNRLKAYEYFLKRNPQYHDNVVFIIVIVPSRDGIAKYAERKGMIDQLISQINSQIGNIHWQPVVYQYNCLSFNEMLALYTACDIALITPLRDGMNLVAKEFVASRKDQKGVLILSEMAGASRELPDALNINPNDILEMADKIKEGLEMGDDEQKARMTNMQRRIANYDVQTWGEDFISELETMKLKQGSFQIKFLDDFEKRMIYDAYRNSTRRLLLLDYDGTLVAFSPKPELAVPGIELLRLVADLASVKENDVFIISGRNSAWLHHYFGKLPINLIAEHGACYKWKDGGWETDLQTHNEWKDGVHHIMEMYVRRCAGSFVEEKDFSMVWHYRNANLEQGKLRALELTSELKVYLHNRHLQVLMGNRIVEVRQSGINKGAIIKKVIASKTYDYIFAVGDDRTDEDMFKVLLEQSNTFTIKVGPEASYAQFNLHSPQMVVSFLEGMTGMPKPLISQY